MQNRSIRKTAKTLLLAGSILTASSSLHAAHAQAVDVAVPPAPMGWASWNSFGTDITETIIKDQANAIKEFNTRLPQNTPKYTQVNIDAGFWMIGQGRRSDGSQNIDATKWTGGSLKSSVNYIHSLGLKAGAYMDVGFNGCAGHAGSEGYYFPDIQRFADNGFDYVKVDFCGGRGQGLGPKEAYSKIALAVQSAVIQAQRDIYLSICNWGFYGPPGFSDSGKGPWTWAPGINGIASNMWRTSDDITFAVGSNARASAEDVLVNFRANYHPEAQHTGYYNDPDMMVIGMDGVDFNPADPVQSRAHMSLWAVSGAPLMMGNNMKTLLQQPQFSAILTNPAVIKIDQDSRGLPPIRVDTPALGQEIYARRLAGKGQRAVVLLNTNLQPVKMSFTASQLGLLPTGALSVKDVWSNTPAERASGRYEATVPAFGTMMFLVSGTDMTSVPSAARAGTSPAGYPTFTATLASATSARTASVYEGETHLDIEYVNERTDTVVMAMTTNDGEATNVAFPPTGRGGRGTVSVVNLLKRTGPNTVSFQALDRNAGPRVSTVSVAPGPVPGLQPASFAAEATTIVTGAASLGDCSACPGGKKVSYVGTGWGNSGTVTFGGITAPQDGTYRINIAYLSAESRQATVEVNGGAAQTASFYRAKDWNTVQVTPVTVSLKKGVNSLTFSNAAGFAPDITALSAPLPVVTN
jgi:alpha-galactosidase